MTTFIDTLEIEFAQHANPKIALKQNVSMRNQFAKRTSKLLLFCLKIQISYNGIHKNPVKKIKTSDSPQIPLS